MSHRVIFELDGLEDDLTPQERAFVAETAERSGTPSGEPVYGTVSWDEVTDALVASVSLGDPEARLALVDLGVHFAGDRVRGDRLHSQLHSLPEDPSPWALDATGSIDELAGRSAEWFARMLRRPIALYVWLHEQQAYAARYVFADSDETLCQSYVKQLAPAGQAEGLIADGHVRGQGWIQTAGLPAPNLYLHIRGDREAASLPPGVKEATKRGQISGVWYE
ncbi:hypothetical protein [Spirillospora sp. NPDC029432]|uniref:hypothetical protein n=1 Tax=Spirillospora sp. NPDC029432 TaxID=3154599 RepID=UPI0034541DB7